MRSSACFGLSSSGRISSSICAAFEVFAGGGAGGSRKERQIVQQGGGLSGAFALAAFQRLEHHAGAGHDRGREPGQLRHLHAVGTVGGALSYLVQEDHFALPFLDRDGGVLDAVELARQGGQFVVVGGE